MSRFGPGRGQSAQAVLAVGDDAAVVLRIRATGIFPTIRRLLRSRFGRSCPGRRAISRLELPRMGHGRGCGPKDGTSRSLTLCSRCPRPCRSPRMATSNTPTRLCLRTSRKVNGCRWRKCGHPVRNLSITRWSIFVHRIRSGCAALRWGRRSPLHRSAIRKTGKTRMERPAT